MKNIIFSIIFILILFSVNSCNKVSNRIKNDEFSIKLLSNDKLFIEFNFCQSTCTIPDHPNYPNCDDCDQILGYCEDDCYGEYIICTINCSSY